MCIQKKKIKIPSFKFPFYWPLAFLEYIFGDTINFKRLLIYYDANGFSIKTCFYENSLMTFNCVLL